MDYRLRTTAAGGFTIEYAVLTAVVTAALIGMAFFLQRGLAGQWREGADTFGFGRQYEPGKTVSVSQ